MIFLGNIVLFSFSYHVDTGSALCSMRKSLLDDLFYDTMDSCYKHLGYNGSRQIAHLVNGETCTNTKGGANKVSQTFLLIHVLVNIFVDFFSTTFFSQQFC